MLLDAKYLSADEICARLRISKKTFRRLVQRGMLPPPTLSLGRASKWEVTSLEAFLQAQRVAGVQV